MFNAAFEHIHILAEELKAFNPNIDWETVLMKARNKTDEEILENIIKPKIWVEKSHGQDLDERLRIRYIKHFTKLFKRYNYVDRVYIVTYTDDNEHYIPEELIHLLRQKESALNAFLRINQITIDTSPSRNTYIFPLYSIITPLKTNDNDRIIKDNDLWAFTIHDKSINRILLAVKMLQLGTPINDIVRSVKDFYFL